MLPPIGSQLKIQLVSGADFHESPYIPWTLPSIATSLKRRNTANYRKICAQVASECREYNNAGLFTNIISASASRHEGDRFEVALELDVPRLHGHVLTSSDDRLSVNPGDALDHTLVGVLKR